MAAGEFVIKVKIEGDGKGAKLVSSQVDKATQSQDNLGQATNRAEGAQRTQNKTMQDGVRGTANSTKSFSKLAETVGGGLVGAYAALAANVFAVSAAFVALRGAEQAQMVLQGLELQGARTGRTLTIAAKQLGEVLDFGISAQEQMQATAQFTSAGFSGDELLRLGQVAENTSFALGRNLTDSIDRLIKGTVKLEPELLDELGIMTKLGEATNKYAIANNKSEASLTSFERRQAFLNAVLEEGEVKFGGIAEQMDSNPYDRLAASFTNLNKTFLGFVNDSLGVGGVVGFLADNAVALTGTLVLFASTIKGQVLGSMADLTARSVDAAKAEKEHAKQLIATAKAQDTASAAAKRRQLSQAKVVSISPESSRGVKLYADQFAKGTASVAQFDRAISNNAKSIKTHNRLLEDEKAKGLSIEDRQRKIQLLTQQQQALEASRTATQEYIKVANAEVVIGKQAIIARSAGLKASALEARADAVNAASKGNLKVSFDNLTLASRRYAISLELLTRETLKTSTATGALAVAQGGLLRGFNLLKVGAFTATTAIIGIGSALLSFAGFIGIAFIAWGLLSTAWDSARKFLFPRTTAAQEELSASVEAATEILESSRKATVEYNRVLDSSASLSTKVARTNVIKANSAIELVGAYEDLVQKEKELKAAREADALSDASSPSFVSPTASIALAGGQDPSLIAGSALNEQIIKEYEEAGKAAEKAAESISGKLIKAVDDSSESGEALKNAIVEISNRTSNSKINERLERLGINLDNITQVDIERFAKDYSASAQQLLQGTEALNAAFKQGEEESTKFVNSLIPSTPFDQIISSYEQIGNAIFKIQQSNENTPGEIAALISSIGPSLSLFLDDNANQTLETLREQAAVVETLTSLTRDLTLQEQQRLGIAEQKLAAAEGELDTLIAAFDVAEDELRAKRSAVSLSKLQASYEQARLGTLSDVLSGTVEGLKVQIESENRIKDLNIASLAAEKSIVDAKLAQQRATLEEARIGLEDLKAKRDSLELQKQLTKETYKQFTLINELIKQVSLVPIIPSIQLRKVLGQMYEEFSAELSVQRQLEETNNLIKERERSLKDLAKAMDDTSNAARALELQIAIIGVTKISPARAADQLNIRAQELALESFNKRRINEETLTNNIIEVERLTAITSASRKVLSQELTNITKRAEFERKSIIEQKKLEQSVFAARVREFANLIKNGELVSDLEVAAANAKIRQIDEEAAHTGFMRDLELQTVNLQERSNILGTVGLETEEARLDLATKYTDQLTKGLQLQLDLNRSREEFQVSLKNATADILQVTIPGETVRELEREQKFREKQAELEKQRLESEYALLRAQYTLEKVKLDTLLKYDQFMRNRILAEGGDDQAARLAQHTLDSQSIEALTTASNAIDTLLSGETRPDGSINTSSLAGQQRLEEGNLEGPLVQGELDIQKAKVVQFTDEIVEQYNRLGPDGEAALSLIQGMTAITYATQESLRIIRDDTATTTDKLSAIATTVSSVLNTIMSVLSASTDAKIANIDREIAAEQKRDGRSAESIKRIDAFERKKDKIAKKAFETNKKLMMANAIISTAAAVATTLGTFGPLGVPLAIAIGAMGLAQVALIAGTQYESSYTPSAATAPSSITIGSRDNSVDLAKGPNANAGGEIGYIRGAQGYGNNANNFNPIGSAYGGHMQRGYGRTGFVVGEKGPEIMTPETPINVTPVSQATVGNTISPNFYISALDSKGVEEILVKQKGNIISMLRDAANANGQDFLEDVDANSYTSPSTGKLI